MSNFPTDFKNFNFSDFWKIKSFFSIPRKIFESNSSFLRGWKTIFLRKKSPLIVKPWSLSKKPCFLLLNHKNVFRSFQKCVKIMVESGIRAHHLWLCNCDDTHTFVWYKNPTVLLCYMRSAKSGRNGQFQEKEKTADYWIEYFPFKKFFRRNLESSVSCSLTGLLPSTP